MYDNGNKYFKNRRLYKDSFVEDYLSRNNRALNNFMTRVFILAPNLVDKMYKNPKFYVLKKAWRHEGKLYGTVPWRGKAKVVWSDYKAPGMYVQHYQRQWNKFLRECIDDGEKKFNSPFKKGESYNFKLKHDTRI